MSRADTTRALAQKLARELSLEAALQDRAFLVTGATGLIGGALVSVLCALSGMYPGLNLRIIAHGRSKDRLEQLFPDMPGLEFIIGDITDLAASDQHFDYLVHAAAPTSSKFYVERPVETIESIALGTHAVLESARMSKATSTVVLSSMEVYGGSLSEEPLTEDRQCYLDPRSLRSSYPQAKRLAETLCVAFAHEYNVPVKIVRLGQVIGHELLPDDNRLIAHLIRSAQAGQAIELATDGKSKQTYLGLDDTLSAIFYLLLKGEQGHAYNAANEETYCSVKDLAELAIDLAPEKTPELQLRVSQQQDTTLYPPTRFLRLDSSALRALGWAPTQDLRHMLAALMA